ncbi:DNA polymerase IV [Mycoplasmopsis caviae]|uniref:DNA polymerase IV n=1 Tax=Mycoplasmopsis caviae TaxID=55603 RepID=A0A3P8KMM8_9BACT|nr:DNA polymerase IV [Mycoplasmopsis caviae]UUD35115.1 DNA polymerase IV [Mycoplasmopsis caviae]VDR42068.1 DNA polymerase IV [Mycoplasmopsis caviae]
MNKKVIFHMDFDSYFVSAHRSINPALKNKPVAIGRRLKRSIVSSVSYELKKKGAKVGWPKNKILDIDPHTVFVEPNFDLYLSLSNKIFEYISEKYTKNIEVFSIDECWMDVSDVVGNSDPCKLAKKIQSDILNHFDIPLTIGISYNKFLAKLSTNLGKPFGILQTKLEDIPSRIWPLPIIDFFGIGKPTAERLQKLQINTIGDLANSSWENLKLQKIFGTRTKGIILEAQGSGSNLLNYGHNDLKNIGNELTFLTYDIDDRKEILLILRNLCAKVSRRAKNRNSLPKVISCSIRDTNKTWHSKQKTMSVVSNDEDIIFKEASKLFEILWNEEAIRGIGVRLHKLVSEFEYGKQLSIFTKPEDENTQTFKIKNIINDVNYQLRDKKLKLASEYNREKKKQNIQTKFLQEDIAKKNL